MSTTPRFNVIPSPSAATAAGSPGNPVISPQPTQRRRLSKITVSTTWASIVKKKNKKSHSAADEHHHNKQKGDAPCANPCDNHPRSNLTPAEIEERMKIQCEMTEINRQIDKKLGLITKNPRRMMVPPPSQHVRRHSSQPLLENDMPPSYTTTRGFSHHDDDSYVTNCFSPQLGEGYDDYYFDDTDDGFEGGFASGTMYEEENEMCRSPPGYAYHHPEAVDSSLPHPASGGTSRPRLPSNKPLWPTPFPRGGEEQHYNMFSPAIVALPPSTTSTDEEEEEERTSDPCAILLLGYHYSPYDVDVFPAYWQGEDEGEFLYPVNGRTLPLSVRQYQQAHPPPPIHEEEEEFIEAVGHEKKEATSSVGAERDEAEAVADDQGISEQQILESHLPPDYDEVVSQAPPTYAAFSAECQREQKKLVEGVSIASAATPVKQKTTSRQGATDNPALIPVVSSRSLSPHRLHDDEPQTLPSTPRGQRPPCYQQSVSQNFSFPGTDVAQFTNRSSITTAEVSPLAPSTQVDEEDLMSQAPLPRGMSQLSGSNGEQELVFDQEEGDLSDSEEEERELLLDQIVITSIKYRPKRKAIGSGGEGAKSSIPLAPSAKDVAALFALPLPRSKQTTTRKGVPAKSPHHPKKETTPLKPGKQATPLPSVDNSPEAMKNMLKKHSSAKKSKTKKEQQHHLHKGPKSANKKLA